MSYFDQEKNRLQFILCLFLTDESKYFLWYDLIVTLIIRSIIDMFWSVKIPVLKPETTQQTQDFEAMLVYRWSTVYDAGPTSNQH